MEELILGIGNTLKGDDGVGVYIVEKVGKYLKKVGKNLGKDSSTESKKGVITINCGTTPENYTSVIRKHKPDRLILIDAADMGLTPGSYRIIPLEKMGVMCISTHKMPLAVFLSYVSEFCRDTVLIGIQPEGMDFGIALSSVVRRGGDQVVKHIIEKRLNEIKTLN